MKSKLFMLFTAVFYMFSCNSDRVSAPDEDQVTGTYSSSDGLASDTLSVPNIPDQPGDPEIYPPLTEFPDAEEGRNPDFKDDYNEPLEIVLNGSDIKSYNETTKEIKFADEISENLINNCYRVATLYINDEPLFEGELKTVYPFDSNSWWGYVALYVECDFDEALNKRINARCLLFNSERNDVNQGSVYEYDSAKRKRDWDRLIMYLNDEGKLISY